MTVTRFGRSVKKPVLYVPAEEVLVDDYASDEHDSVIDLISTPRMRRVSVQRRTTMMRMRMVISRISW